MKIFGKEIKGVIFDLDGTLLDSMWVWTKVDCDFLAENGIQVTDDYTEKVKQMHFEESALYTKQRYNLKQSTEDIKRRWIEMVEHEYACNIRLKPYALEFIKYLLNNGVRVCYATTLFGEIARPCLKSNGIDSISLGVECPLTTIEEVSRGKGFSDIYDRASQKINVKAGECMIFEDIPLAIQGAKAGGYEFCGVYDCYSNKNSDFESMCTYYIKGFEEIFEHIENN